MINTDDSIKHIGRGYKDLLLVEFLDRLHIYDLPFTPEEDEAFSDYPAVAYANSRDSRIVEIERYSMHMIYEDREKYALLYNENVEDSFVLKELVFYSDGIQDFMGFKGKLPFGISMEGHRTELHSNKNMRFIASRKIYDVDYDIFYADGFILNIGSVDSEYINIVRVRKPHIYDIDMLGLVNNKKFIPEYVDYPDIRQLVSLFGRSIYCEELKLLLPSFNINEVDSHGCDFSETLDLIYEYGLKLHFDCCNHKSKNDGVYDPGVVLSGIQVVRRGEQHSKGYWGNNFYGITFSATPETIVHYVKRSPDIVDTTSTTVVLIWEENSFILHVVFDVFDYQVKQISYFGNFIRDKII
ncbi:TPA: hypothetical protein ACPWZ0_003076 [Salmonella enterica subsp. enterica serovar Vietnam]|uniref:Uncharacterized protein n=1 Tax=Salmonella enterica subsp. arizonae TaxID=59203 RepID=A0A5Y2QT10_SALER|nr:hypothetical protein [Salmonella enterica]ECF4924900.1 hypothetical protein [Salmonella enterica subsp. arizonae]ECI9863445.1 hypothetical protein [Salmonella enterica subsp. arizonae]HAU3219478.1 hypothetical protein [Salmonella enterica subsp. indica]